MTQINAINSEEARPEDKEDVLEVYGQVDRYLYKENVERARKTSLDQAIGVKEQYAPSNPNDYIYSRTVEFPQPSIVGIGAVTTGGAIDTTQFFFSQKWVPSRTGAGAYTITHNIGDNKYNVLISPIATSAFTANISARNANDFQIKTWNAAGVATDCAFTFTVWMIP
jgi:hypothetical protein